MLKDGVYCLLLSRMALQSWDQDNRRRWVGLRCRCLLWQAVNRMCSQVGLGSTPRMSGLSSIRMSPVTTVLSLVRMICSRNSWPRCFSTQAYFSYGQCLYCLMGLVHKKTSVLSILAISLTASSPPGRGSSSMKKSLDSHILIALSHRSLRSSSYCEDTQNPRLSSKLMNGSLGYLARYFFRNPPSKSAMTPSISTSTRSLLPAEADDMFTEMHLHLSW